jgi:hypothetical protein
MRLNLKRKAKKRIATRGPQPLLLSAELNRVWALDFMRDTMYDGRPLRTLNVIDEGNREALRIECGTSISATRVVRVLNQLVEVYGKPEAIRRKRIRWAVAMTPGHRKALDPNKPLNVLKDKAERIKASIRAKVEHQSGLSSASSATRRRATAGWPRTQRRSRRCSCCRTCG